MRVLCYTQDFRPAEGGIEVYVTSLARELQRLGHEILVVVRSSGHPAEPAFDRAEPYRIERLRRYFKPAFVYRSYAWLRLRRLVRIYRPDLVWIGHWFRHAVAATRAIRSLAIPYVVTCYGEEVMFDGARAHRSDRRLLRGYRGAARVLAISRDTAQRLVAHGVDPARAALVPCGVEGRYLEAQDPGRVAELRSALGAGDGAPLILTVARLVPKKGQDHLIRALAALSGRFPEARLAVAGRGPHRAALEALARDLGVAARVRFAGFVPDETLPVFYAAADVFALTTRDVDGSGRTEGFGIVYLEANALGRPVVGGSQGGVTDAVADGETGLLCDAASVDSIASALARLLEDPALRSRLGERGRARALAEFSWPTIGRRFEAALFEALRGR